MVSPLLYYILMFSAWTGFVFVSTRFLRQMSLFIGFLLFIWSLYITLIYQYYLTIFDESVLLYSFSLFNWSYQLQLDGISIYFIVLSNLLLVFCLLVNWI